LFKDLSEGGEEITFPSLLVMFKVIQSRFPWKFSLGDSLILISNNTCQFYAEWEDVN